jgi:hypothetical protein
MSMTWGQVDQQVRGLNRIADTIELTGARHDHQMDLLTDEIGKLRVALRELIAETVVLGEMIRDSAPRK